MQRVLASDEPPESQTFKSTTRDSTFGNVRSQTPLLWLQTQQSDHSGLRFKPTN